MDSVLRRNSWYFTHRLEHDLRLAFLLHKSFFISRCFTLPSINRVVLRFLNHFCGICLTAAPRNKSFHFIQWALISKIAKSRWLSITYRVFQSACWKSKTVLLLHPLDLAWSRKSKNIRWWSVEMPIVVSGMHEWLTMFSGADVKTRSRILLHLVGHMFTYSNVERNQNWVIWIQQIH